MHNGPGLWSNILANLFDVKSATVAGGAVRDYLMNKPHRDIDVFVNLKELHKVFRHFNDDACWIHVEDAIGEYPLDGNIAKIYKTKYKDRWGEEHDVDVIFVYDSVRGHILHTFDFPICMAWYRKNTISFDHSFSEILEPDHDKIIRSVNNIWSTKERVDAHIERLKVKYPEYTFVNRAPEAPAVQAVQL